MCKQADSGTPLNLKRFGFLTEFNIDLEPVLCFLLLSCRQSQSLA